MVRNYSYNDYCKNISNIKDVQKMYNYITSILENNNLKIDKKLYKFIQRERLLLHNHMLLKNKRLSNKFGSLTTDTQSYFGNKKSNLSDYVDI